MAGILNTYDVSQCALTLKLTSPQRSTRVLALATLVTVSHTSQFENGLPGLTILTVHRLHTDHDIHRILVFTNPRCVVSVPYGYPLIVKMSSVHVFDALYVRTPCMRYHTLLCRLTYTLRCSPA